MASARKTALVSVVTTAAAKTFNDLGAPLPMVSGVGRFGLGLQINCGFVLGIGHDSSAVPFLRHV